MNIQKPEKEARELDRTGGYSPVVRGQADTTGASNHNQRANSLSRRRKRTADHTPGRKLPLRPRRRAAAVAGRKCHLRL